MKSAAISGAGPGFRREVLPGLKAGVPIAADCFELAPENRFGLLNELRLAGVIPGSKTT